MRALFCSERCRPFDYRQLFAVTITILSTLGKRMVLCVSLTPGTLAKTGPRSMKDHSQGCVMSYGGLQSGSLIYTEHPRIGFSEIYIPTKCP